MCIRDRGISFQNGGNSYTWNIVRKENVNVVNTAHLVFRGNQAGPQATITDLTDYLTLYAGGDLEFGVGNTGIGTAPDSNYKLKVAGEIYADTSLTIRDASNNDGAPIYFLGATGAGDGAGGYLSNFRVGNSMVGGDIFEITSNDGSVGATDWKGTPALAIKGTNNQVAINTTAFGGQDQSDPQNIIDREYSLNVQGDMNINGVLYQNNEEFVTSRWTEATNGADIYRLSKVGINQADPTYQLHIAGDVQIEGTSKTNGQVDATLYVNGQRQWVDSYGVIKVQKTTIDEDVTIPAGVTAYSVGDIEITNGNTVTVSTNATWLLV